MAWLLLATRTTWVRTGFGSGLGLGTMSSQEAFGLSRAPRSGSPAQGPAMGSSINPSHNPGPTRTSSSASLSAPSSLLAVVRPCDLGQCHAALANVNTGARVAGGLSVRTRGGPASCQGMELAASPNPNSNSNWPWAEPSS